MKKQKFSHIGKRNLPKIVNITNKKKTKRIAIAEANIKFNKNKFNKIMKNNLTKGEIENTSILAGIMGTKKTSELIPLCHNIPIEDVIINIYTITITSSLRVVCTVKTSAKTGVEMEALTGVAITCLSIYDMCKSIDKSIKISNIRLIEKKGGKSGNYKI